jgi:glycosyltransferase involved in cell wall biosynthesis
MFPDDTTMLHTIEHRLKVMSAVTDEGEARHAARPLVSVVIPTRNRARLLGRALDSVHTQEGTGEEFDVEVVVVDDASSDDTQEVVRGYPRVRVIRLDERRGAAAARNRAIRASGGAYVAFLDDDDMWLPHRLRLHLPVLEGSPEIGAVYGQQISRTGGEDTQGGSVWPDARRAPSGNVFEEFLREEFISINTLLVRRSAFEKAGYFDETLETLEHYEFGVRLSFHVPVVFVPGPVAIQDLSGRDGSTYWNGKSYGGAIRAIVEKGLSWVSDTPESAQVRRRAHKAALVRSTEMLGALGDINRLRDDMVTLVHEQLWLLGDRESRTALRRGICKVSVALTKRAGGSLGGARTLSLEIDRALAARGIRERFEVRRFLAEAWISVAVALREGGDRDDRIAGWAVVRGIAYDATQLKRLVVLKVLVRSVLAGRRWDSVFAHLRGLRRLLK